MAREIIQEDDLVGASHKNTGHQIFEIFLSLRTDETDINGAYPCDGREFSKTDFTGGNNPYDMLLLGKAKTLTYTAWNSEVSSKGICFSFALDTANEKFKIPKLTSVSTSIPGFTGNSDDIASTVASISSGTAGYVSKFRPFVQLATESTEVSVDVYKNQLNNYTNALKESLNADYGTIVSDLAELKPEIITFSGSTATLNLQANKVYNQTGTAISSLTIGSSYPQTSPYETLIFFKTGTSGTPSITFPADFVSLNTDAEWVLETNTKYVISLLYGVFAIHKLVENVIS